MPLILLVVVLLLAGCSYDGFSPLGAGDAEWGRVNLPGKNLDYAEACIGTPNSYANRSDGGQILEWTTAEPSVPVSLPMSVIGNIPGLAAAVNLPIAAFTGAFSAQIGGGNGRLILVVDTQRIIQEVHMSGPADSFSGTDGLIGSDLLRGCRRDAERLHLTRQKEQKNE